MNSEAYNLPSKPYFSGDSFWGEEEKGYPDFERPPANPGIYQMTRSIRDYTGGPSVFWRLI